MKVSNLHYSGKNFLQKPFPKRNLQIAGKITYSKFKYENELAHKMSQP